MPESEGDHKQLPILNHLCAGNSATWLLGRVVSVPHRDAAYLVLGDVEHVISREQAIMLGTRLLEVGIGTNYAEERAINAQIGDLIAKGRKLKNDR